MENHEAGLLYIEGKFIERLPPGRHTYWTVNRKVEVKRIDLRPKAVEITAQEMLTKDRIAPRVTLTAFRRIVDPERAAASTDDVDTWLYRLIQFAIREAVAGRTLDEVLSARGALDAELRDFVRARLLRLKELESLEKLVEKVGRIDLHAGEGQGFDALLNRLIRLKPPADM